MTNIYPEGFLRTGSRIKKAGGRVKRTIALAATVSLMGQNFAWAVCSNGQPLPAGGFVVGSPQVADRGQLVAGCLHRYGGLDLRS